MTNKHGLSRKIPDAIKREVRKRSKFGCVICRSAIIVYEHIEPRFEDAKTHEADNICCLCGSCHDKVTRGHYSKAYVRQMYVDCGNATSNKVQPPFDFLDFHDGKAALEVGGIRYDPGVRCVLKYYGTEVISISPTSSEAPGSIKARFFDSEGQKTLEIQDNVWEGAVDAWDTEVVGSCISVRKKKGLFSLKLRLDPPGKIVIQQLDMRLGDAHILVSERSHAFGRYVTEGQIQWLHANTVSMGTPLPDSSAIEFLDPMEIEYRDRYWIGRGHRLATQDNQIVMQAGLGVTFKPMGVIVGAQCLTVGYAEFAIGGPRSLAKMRKYVFRHPDHVSEFIISGQAEGVR